MEKQKIAVQINFAPFALGKAGVVDRKNYVGALLSEISSVADYADRFTVGVLSLTGSNPLQYKGERLGSIIDALRITLPFEKKPEITVYALPGTVTYGELLALSDAGVNRISFDMGTFIERELNALGRTYSPSAIEVFMRMVQKKFTFFNYDITLYYGFPGQTIKSFQLSLEMAMRFMASHLTLLPYEKAESDRKQAFYQAALDVIGPANFKQYTPHHFARKDYEGQWNKLPYSVQNSLSFGVGAGWLVDGVRCINTSNVAAYIKADGNPEETIANVKPITQFEFDTTMLLDKLYNLKDCELASIGATFQERINSLCERGLMEVDGGVARLTTVGKADWLSVAGELSRL